MRPGNVLRSDATTSTIQNDKEKTMNAKRLQMVVIPTTLLVVSFALVMVLTQSTAYAAGAVAQIDVGGCGVTDAAGNTVFAVGDCATDPNCKSKVKVSTESTNDNLILSCRVSNVPNNTGRALHYPEPGDTDAVCHIFDPLRGEVRDTDTWSAVVSTSGEAVLSCELHTP